MYLGTIVDRDVDKDLADSTIFGVLYDDGDREDLTAAELAPLLLPPTSSDNPVVSDCAPCFVSVAAQAAVDLGTNHKVPKHFGQIRGSPDCVDWMKAVSAELGDLKDMGCYALVRRRDVPAGDKIIGYTWVFRLKTNADGTVSRFKARICVNGSQQRHHHE